MTLRDASESLGRFLSGTSNRFPNWLLAVGMADGRKKELIVYLKRRKHSSIPAEWGGYLIRTVYVGDMKPV